MAVALKGPHILIELEIPHIILLLQARWTPKPQPRLTHWARYPNDQPTQIMLEKAKNPTGLSEADRSIGFRT